MRILPFFIAALIALAFVPSCISDELTDSPSVRLEFSVDTLSFDTIFTEAGSTTARLKVFNPDKKGVVIERIQFRNPDGNFTLNVDGMAGKVFHDVEIRGRDSIFIFVECYIEPTESMTTFRVADKLDFLTNGTLQSLEVEAFGINAERLAGKVLTTDAIFTGKRPYIIYDSLVVAEGVHLKMGPGTRLLFHDGAKLVVRGTLDARGTPADPIDFRGDRLDDVIPNTPYDLLAGQWAGVYIEPTSNHNWMECVNMRSTVDGLIVKSSGSLEEQRLTVVNSWLHNSQNRVLTVDNARTTCAGVCFSEAAMAVVCLTGGVHEFSQCTFANNYLFAVITEPLLVLNHVIPDISGAVPETPYMQATISNSILYGLCADINIADLTGSQVFLDHLLLRSSGTNDDNFFDILWAMDPLFMTVRDNYYFDYRLKSTSPAAAAGDPALVNPLTTIDMYGTPRFLEGEDPTTARPTLGAYAELVDVNIF